MKIKSLIILLVLLVLSVIVVSLYACPPAVVADLDAFKTHETVNRPVILDGSGSYTEGTATIAEYAWDFNYEHSSFTYIETPSSHGDGAFDGITTHTYDSTGEYYVLLRVKDSTTLSDTEEKTVIISTDTNTNRLPDSWETLYGVSSPTANDDTDIYNNLQEYLHGSDPKDGQSIPTRNITIYVNQDNTIGDVSTIQGAINVAINGDTIVVAEDTYTENISTNGKFITLKSSDPNDWEVVSNTIIQADDSSEPVIECAYGVSIYGLKITGGSQGIYCSCGNTPPTDHKLAKNCIITGNTGGTSSSGGGIELTGFAFDVVISNCYIYSNSSTSKGGGISVYDGDFTVINSVFYDNSSDDGGAIEFHSDTMYGTFTGNLINCTFYDNDADKGGAIYKDNFIINVNNCILWSNSATTGGSQIYNYNEDYDTNLSHSLIEGGLSATSCHYACEDLGSNITDDSPVFYNVAYPDGEDSIFGTEDDGLQLTLFSSPCIDSGDPYTGISSVGSVDITGNERFLDGNHDDSSVIDMGAYETTKIWFVDRDATEGGNDGSSWADAFVDLQSAISEAQEDECIWVAEGIYYPTTNYTYRSVKFELVEGVSIYGGFNGSETARSQRDWTKHRTLLSGDIDRDGLFDSGNSRIIVEAADDVILDGFIITGAYQDTGQGGALRNYDCSSTILNCVFRDNTAAYSGAAVLNVGYTKDIYPIFTNCFFMDNDGPSGGAVYNSCAHGTFTNCVFGNNDATDGGAMYNSHSSPVVTNCTFAGNTATTGGAIYNADVDCSPEFVNTVIWGNTATTASQVYNNSSSPTYIYCNVEGTTGSSNPYFANSSRPAGNDDTFGTYDDGLRLLTGSGCIDVGDGRYAPELDVLGLARKDMPSVANGTTIAPAFTDIGSYESYDDIDTDMDGLPDDWELLYGLPTGNDGPDDDFDEDGLTNIREYELGTRPDTEDTDGDQMDDKWEVEYNFDPLEDDDASEDYDGDGMTNFEEYQNGSNPLINNSQTIVEYTYDNAGNILTETVKNNVGTAGTVLAVTENSYNALGRQWRTRRWASTTASSNSNDIITLYDFDTRGNITKTVQKGVGSTNPAAIETTDLVTENTYDSLGRVEMVEDPEGGETSYTYYPGGKIHTITDQMNNVTTREYDDAGRLEKITDAEYNYRTMEYDSLDRVIKEYAYDDSHVALMQTRSEYDNLNHLTRRVVMADADSTSVTISTTADMVVDYTYNSSDNGLLSSQTKYYASGTSATTSYGYDDLGRLETITDPATNVTTFSYDAADQVVERQQVDDNPLTGGTDLTITTGYVYDSKGKLISQIDKADASDPDTWQSTIYSYDALGNLLMQKDPDNIVTVYNYNALGQMVSKVEDSGTTGMNRTTDYGYDRIGRQATIKGYAVGATAQTTTYTYDKLGNITNIEYPDNDDITYVYNDAGRVTQRTDQRDIITTYAYDNNYNLLSKSVTYDSVDYEESFTYDGLGRMLTAVKTADLSNPISNTVFQYSDIGQVTYTTETHFANTTKSIDYDHDQAGYLTSIDYPDGSTVVNITPDYQGRISSLSLGATNIVNYDYMGSRVAQRYYPVPGIYYMPLYDNFGRITTSQTYIGSTDITKFNYDYEPLTDNISDMEYAHRGTGSSYTTEFSYDDLDRLTLVDYKLNGGDEQFSLDKLGNRTEVNDKNNNTITYTMANNLTNRYSSVGAASLAYDDAGNITADEQGYQYEYDYENRIVKITKNNNTIAEYAYDALGRRISKIAGADTRLYYYNNNSQVLVATDAGGNLKEWNIFGNYIDEAVYTMAGYYIHDHLYSVVAITNGQGVVQERVEYDAYGLPTFYSADFANSYPVSQLPTENPYLFTGRRVDFLDSGSLKLQYNRNRYYSYTLGRWMTQDPLGITPNPQSPNYFYPMWQYKDGLNVYEYVKSRPIDSSDAYGLKTVCCKVKLHSDSNCRVCEQHSVAGKDEWSAEKICRCAYCSGEKIEVYETQEKACCWCNVYVVHTPVAALGGIDAHKRLMVSCGSKDMEHKKWGADVGVGAEQNFNIQPEKVRMYDAFERGELLGMVSCKVAENMRKELEGMTWNYQFPFNDCWTFVRVISSRMFSECP